MNWRSERIRRRKERSDRRGPRGSLASIRNGATSARWSGPRWKSSCFSKNTVSAAAQRDVLRPADLDRSKSRRLTAMYVICLAGAAVVLARLFSMQHLERERWITLALKVFRESEAALLDNPALFAEVDR